MTDLDLDPARSCVRIQTSAEGFLARLAHDLELACGDLTGTASGDRASIRAPLSGMSVIGILGKDGRLDDQGLSPAERRDVITKMHEEVFHATPEAAVRVESHLDGGKARVRVLPPSGTPFDAEVHVTVDTKDTDVRATGTFEVSLRGIGSDSIKGPLGAFRVKDRVKVTFDVMFIPRGSGD